MANDDPWRDQVQAAADRAGEPVWPLPLPKEYRKLLESEIADLKNISNGGYGGALTAGLFLQEFVTSDMPWAHLDIAGPARANGDDGYLVKGGTGFGVRTLIELVTNFDAPAKKAATKKAPAKKATAKRVAAKRVAAKKVAAKKAPAAKKASARKRPR